MEYSHEFPSLIGWRQNYSKIYIIIYTPVAHKPRWVLNYRSIALSGFHRACGNFLSYLIEKSWIFYSIFLEIELSRLVAGVRRRGYGTPATKNISYWFFFLANQREAHRGFGHRGFQGPGVIDLLEGHLGSYRGSLVGLIEGHFGALKRALLWAHCTRSSTNRAWTTTYTS